MMVKATLRDYLQTTEEAINSGRLDEAQTSCQKILAQYPESLEAQRLLGEIYLGRDQFEQARQTFDWILINDPENVLVYCDRAVMSEKLADIDTALDCYQQAYELSRGNRDIRQQFNQLSAQVGQQGFMLSRAGLARLYMRGDLLSQAIQEWETVLASTPDRLDARTGLLEACWREGLYDRAEELASQLLNEYPSNLKALLLLAHTTSIRNMDRAQELLQQAYTLDPDMVITQELFRELAINQPADPFLPLLNKEPGILKDQDDASASITPPSSSYLAPKTPNAHTPIPDSSPAASLDPWNPGNQDSQVWQPYASSFSGISAETPSDAEQNQADLTGNEPAWYQDAMNFNARPSTSDWNNQDFSNDAENPPTFRSADTASTNRRTNAPAWLDMLNVNDYAQPMDTAFEAPMEVKPASKPTPTPIPEVKQAPSAPLPKPKPAPEPKFEPKPVLEPKPEPKPVFEPKPEPKPMFEPKPVLEPKPEPKAEPLPEPEPEPEQQAEDPNPFFFGDSDSETDMSWPTWLKSLGATEIDPNQASTTMPAMTPEVLEQYRQAEEARTQDKAPEIYPTPQTQNTPREPKSDVAVNNPPSQPQNTSRELNPESAFNGLITRPLSGAGIRSEQPEEFTASFDPLSPEEFSPALKSENLQHYMPETSPATSPWQQEQGQSSNVSPEPSWLDQAALPNEKPNDETEQNLLATLESLEHNLLSQGFVPMTGSLSNIAQQLQNEPASPEPPSAFTELGASNTPYSFEPQNFEQPNTNFSFQHDPIPNSPEEDTVSRAIDPLAFRSPNYQDYQPSQPAQSSWQPEQTPQAPDYSSWQQEQTPKTPDYSSWQSEQTPQEPAYSSWQQEQTPQEPAYSSWQQEQTPQAPAQSSWQQEQTPQEASHSPFAAFTQPQQGFNAQPDWQQQLSSIAPNQPAPSQPIYEQAAAEPQNDLEKTISAYYTETSQLKALKKPEATNMPNANHAAVDDTNIAPIYRNDALLDNELETTMRRPAIKLQSIHQRGHGDRSQSLLSRARSANQSASNPSDSNRDRLLRGYQLQLSGNYDEAMGEYRLIIRNAPELAGEVISNMRALLKLAPKYAAGYRVLGDAYMRQGEYLQAMEAYNKALSMTKKVK